MNRSLCGTRIAASIASCALECARAMTFHKPWAGKSKSQRQLTVAKGSLSSPQAEI
jgi:hypothetical protein